MVADIKEQIENHLETLPMSFNDVEEMMDDGEDEKIILEFIKCKPSETDSEINSLDNKNTFTQNVSIINMLPSKPKEEEKEKYENLISYSEEQPAAKSYKGQYYTKNEFAEYYKNLVESK